VALATLLFAFPAHAQLSAISLKFDKDSSSYTFSANSPVTVYLVATNTSSNSVSFYGVDAAWTYNSSAMSVAIDKNFIPTVSNSGEWAWSTDTGISGSTITVIGTTNTDVTLAAGGSAQIAKFIFTPATSSTISLNKTNARVIQKTTDDNIFDSANSSSSQTYTITGTQILPTNTPFVQFPGSLNTSGPAENMFIAFGGGLVLVGIFYGIIKLRKKHEKNSL
jgi:hypothetical protein